MERDTIKPSSTNFNQTKNTTWKQLKEPSHSLGKVATMKVHHPGKENQKKLTRQLRSLRFERRDEDQSTLMGTADASIQGYLQGMEFPIVK